MRKWLMIVFFSLLMTMTLLAGCGGSNGAPPIPNPTPTFRLTPTATTTPTPSPLPAAITLFSDDFQRADGQVGNNWVDMNGNHNELGTGCCEILNNALRIKTNLTLVNGNAWWTDYSFSANFQVSNLNTAVSFRFRIQDSNNCYSAEIYNTGASGILYIRKLVAGSWDSSSLAGTKSASISYTTNTFYPVRVKVKGNRIKVFFNNQTTPVIDCTDNDPVAPFLGGKVGLCAYAGSSGSPGVFDDALVTSIAPVLYNLHWDGAPSSGGGALNPFEVSTHFDATDLAPYVNGRIVKVKVYLRDIPTGSLALKIYKGGVAQPGSTVVCNQAISLATLSAYSWNEIPLTNPVTVASDDYWVGFSVTSTGVPIGTDAGPLHPKGNWFNNNSSWISGAFTGNWNIQTKISVP